MWGRWFCATCNGKTGEWDEEFLRWQRGALSELAKFSGLGESFLVRFGDADPGAFVRCLWAWAFALDATLIDRLPEVAAAVREGHAVAAPEGSRLLIAGTHSLRIWVTSQREVMECSISLAGDDWHQRESSLWLPGPRVTPALPVVVAAPPFLAVLVDAGERADFPHFDTGSWLIEPARQRRETMFRLPMVEVAHSEQPRPITHRDIVPWHPAKKAG